MGHYSRNHLQDDWDAMDAAAHANRVAKAEQEAGEYFASVTKDQKAEYDATMRSLLGMTGPRWDRARDAAKAAWKVATAPASELYDRTVECILETGEVSEELSTAWDALRSPAPLPADQFVVVGDHDPEPRRAA